jgi:hypothetical protein
MKITNPSNQHPAAELVLTVDNPLLIVLTPRSFRDAWWRDRKGLLYLREDGLIDYASDHTTKVTIFMSQEFLKQLFYDGWEAYLSYPDCPWYEHKYKKWRHEADRVLIPVYPSTFTLGGR